MNCVIRRSAAAGGRRHLERMREVRFFPRFGTILSDQANTVLTNMRGVRGIRDVCISDSLT